MSFLITDIPKIMRNKNWGIAAQLLERWFAGLPNSVPKNGSPCLNIVKLDWVLQFQSAKLAYQEIFEKKLWKTPNAQKNIAFILKRKGKLRPGMCTLYDSTEFVLPVNHKDQIQYHSVGGGKIEMLLGDINHLKAALARFNFYITVHGTITAPKFGTKNLYKFTINKIGVYVKDSYDFNDVPGENQPLGNWDIDDNSVGRTPFNGGTSVYNSDFREWRTANENGGDYFIYSDIRFTKLKTPDVIWING